LLLSHDNLPILYDLFLDVDMNEFSFKGIVNIYFENISGNKIILNFKALNIKKINQNNIDLQFELIEETEEIILKIPKELKVELPITISYEGIINDGLAGFYQSKYFVENNERTSAVTQFFESEARQLLPCKDHPRFKSKYKIKVQVDKNYKVISNEAIESQSSVNGRILYNFKTTVFMSSYLLFIGISEWEQNSLNSERVPISTITHPNKIVNTDLSLKFAATSFNISEEFFGFDYPLSKLDLIATPAFHYGAMENFGAILFRENALFIVPNKTSGYRQFQNKVTIAHEISHQWFGNLVTPFDWKYIWLNESFATFLGYLITDKIEHEEKPWEYFLLRSVVTALEADAYIESVPIELPDLNTVAFTIKSVPILYSKGGAIIRQLYEYLGEEKFCQGIKRYMNEFAFKSATSIDLWLSIENEIKEPIKELMESWIFQIGYPVISCTKEGTRLILNQKRFIFLSVNNINKIYHIPVIIDYFDNNNTFLKQEKYVMKDKKLELKLPDETAYYLINGEKTSLTIIKYDEVNFNRLMSVINMKGLSSISRWTILLDCFYLFKANKFSIQQLIEVLNNYNEETEVLPLSQIASIIHILISHANEEQRESIIFQLNPLVTKIFQNIGIEVENETDWRILQLKAELYELYYKFEIPDFMSFIPKICTEVVSNYYNIKGEFIEVFLYLFSLETSDYNYLINIFKQSSDPLEQNNLLKAIASIPNKNQSEMIINLTFDVIPKQFREVYINHLCSNPHFGDKMWDFYINNLKKFEELHVGAYQKAIQHIIEVSIKLKDKMYQHFSEYKLKFPKIKESVEKSFETLDIIEQINQQLNYL
jgi:aminopeptidase N